MSSSQPKSQLNWEEYQENMEKIKKWASAVKELEVLEKKIAKLRLDIQEMETDKLVGNLKGQIRKASSHSISSANPEEVAPPGPSSAKKAAPKQSTKATVGSASSPLKKRRTEENESQPSGTPTSQDTR